MKKKGFTLAEILITLTIVGVISALVMPTFTTRTSTAKIGPSLGKAVSVFESATRTILADEDSVLSDICVDSDGNPDSELLTDRLENHIRGSKINDGVFTSSDGVSYLTKGFDDSVIINNHNTGNNFSGLPHQTVFWDSVMIDINGMDSGPNAIARDRFMFQLMNDGSLRPWGGSWEEEDLRWQNRCPANAKPDRIGSLFCAGHIMENGLKVEYK